MAQTGIAPLESSTLPRQKTIWDTAWRMIRQQPLGSAGLLVILLMTFGAVFADYVVPLRPWKSRTSNTC